MYKNIIYILLGMAVIAVAYVDLTVVVHMLALVVIGATVFFASLWDLLEEQDNTESRHIFN